MAFVALCAFGIVAYLIGCAVLGRWVRRQARRHTRPMPDVPVHVHRVHRSRRPYDWTRDR